MNLPSADQATYRFGSWNNYLKLMGYGPHTLGSADNVVIEAAGLAHVEEVYPGTKIVKAEQNVWDALIPISPDQNKPPEKVEVKASALMRRADNARHMFWSFNVHKRQLSKLVDRLILVGLGYEPEGSDHPLIPLMRLEIPKTSLRLVDAKSTIMMYGAGVFGSSHSIYRPFIKWRRPGVLQQHLPRYLKPNDD